MQRPVLAALLVASTALVACAGDGQETKTIAFLRAVPVADSSQDAFLEELADAGWEVGDDLELLGGDGDEAYGEPADAEAAARGFVDDGADLIVALSSTSAIAAREAAGDVPILFLVNDPVAAGLVTDERAPDGNLTGTTFRVPPDRTLDVLSSLGGIDSVGVLAPADDPGAAGYREDFVTAARQLDIEAVEAVFTTEPGDAAESVRELADGGADAIAIVSAPATVMAFDEIEAAANEVALPVIANTTVAEFALIVLSPDPDAVYRQMGRQAARILAGTEMSEIPVEDPAAFTLTLRAGVADRLGIEVPDELVARADDVIQD